MVCRSHCSRTKCGIDTSWWCSVYPSTPTHPPALSTASRPSTEKSSIDLLSDATHQVCCWMVTMRAPTIFCNFGRCDILLVHFYHVLLGHFCTCVHFRRDLESQVKRCVHICHHIGLQRLSPAHTAHIGSGAESLFLSSIHDQRLVRIVQQHDALVCFRQRQDILATE